MRNIIILIVLSSMFACSNKLKKADAYKNPLMNQDDNMQLLAQMQARGDYKENTSTVVIFHWPEAIDWESNYFNHSMDYYTKLSKLVEGVTFFSDRHDETDEEIYQIGRKLIPWENNGCEDYLEIDEEGIPQICVDLWNIVADLNQRQTDLTGIKSQFINQIRGLLDENFEKPLNWKVLPDDGDDSVIVFGKDWRVIKRMELNKFGPNKVNYTLENGGIRNLEIADNYRITFYLYEKESNNGSYTGKVYKYVLDQDARFIEKHRLKGKIHLYDSNLNLVRKDVGICKIEFNNEKKSL